MFEGRISAPARDSSWLQHRVESAQQLVSLSQALTHARECVIFVDLASCLVSELKATLGEAETGLALAQEKMENTHFCECPRFSASF
ncbi:hypothetical protein U1Q18_041508 [Sarracenia purpurea var. burkii]